MTFKGEEGSKVLVIQAKSPGHLYGKENWVSIGILSTTLYTKRNRVAYFICLEEGNVNQEFYIQPTKLEEIRPYIKLWLCKKLENTVTSNLLNDKLQTLGNDWRISSIRLLGVCNIFTLKTKSNAGQQKL